MINNWEVNGIDFKNVSLDRIDEFTKDMYYVLMLTTIDKAESNRKIDEMKIKYAEFVNVNKSRV